MTQRRGGAEKRRMEGKKDLILPLNFNLRKTLPPLSSTLRFSAPLRLRVKNKPNIFAPFSHSTLLPLSFSLLSYSFLVKITLHASTLARHFETFFRRKL